MTIKLSKAAKNFLLSGGSLRRMLERGIIQIYSGAEPTTADAAATGSSLLIFTDYKGARGGGVQATGTATYTGAMGGAVSTLTVNGVSVIGSAVSNPGTSIASLAAAVANKINTHSSSPDYTASVSGGVVTIIATPGSGTTPNGFVVTGTIAQPATVTTMSGGVTEVSETPPEASFTFSGTASDSSHDQYLYSNGYFWTDVVDIVGGDSDTVLATKFSNSINSFSGTPGATSFVIGATVFVTGDAGTTDEFYNGATISAYWGGPNLGYSIADATDPSLLSPIWRNGVEPASAVAATATIDFTGIVAGGTTSISALTINGVSIITGAIAIAATDALMATAVANSINSKVSAPEYTATVVNSTSVQISAASSAGATPNGYAVAITCLPALAVSGYVNMAGGTAGVALTYTSQTCATGTLTLTGGASGSVNTITVNGVDLIDAAVAYNTSLTQTAADIVRAINIGPSSPEYTATSSGAVITIKASLNTGAAANGFVVAATATTITTSTVNMAGGVSGVNGIRAVLKADDTVGFSTLDGYGSGAKHLLYVSPSAAKDVTTSYFRITVENADTGQEDTEERYIRIQGSVGLMDSAADLKLNRTNIDIEDSLVISDISLSI